LEYLSCNKKKFKNDSGLIYRFIASDIFSYYPKKALEENIPKFIIDRWDYWNLEAIQFADFQVQQICYSNYYQKIDEKIRQITRISDCVCGFIWMISKREVKKLNGNLKSELDNWISKNPELVKKFNLEV
jgi:hypothetical protein